MSTPTALGGGAATTPFGRPQITQSTPRTQSTHGTSSTPSMQTTPSARQSTQSTEPVRTQVMDSTGVIDFGLLLPPASSARVPTAADATPPSHDPRASVPLLGTSTDPGPWTPRLRELVWATVNGMPSWPAVVVSEDNLHKTAAKRREDDTAVMLLDFGTFAWASRPILQPFTLENSEDPTVPRKSTASFLRAVEQARRTLGSGVASKGLPPQTGSKRTGASDDDDGDDILEVGNEYESPAPATKSARQAPGRSTGAGAAAVGASPQQRGTLPRGRGRPRSSATAPRGGRPPPASRPFESNGRPESRGPGGASMAATEESTDESAPVPPQSPTGASDRSADRAPPTGSESAFASMSTGAGEHLARPAARRPLPPTNPSPLREDWHPEQQRPGSAVHVPTAADGNAPKFTPVSATRSAPAGSPELWHAPRPPQAVVAANRDLMVVPPSAPALTPAAPTFRTTPTSTPTFMPSSGQPFVTPAQAGGMAAPPLPAHSTPLSAHSTPLRAHPTPVAAFSLVPPPVPPQTQSMIPGTSHAQADADPVVQEMLAAKLRADQAAHDLLQAYKREFAAFEEAEHAEAEREKVRQREKDEYALFLSRITQTLDKMQQDLQAASKRSAKLAACIAEMRDGAE